MNIWNEIKILQGRKPEVKIEKSEIQVPAGIDLDALAEIFACKQAPDRTIFRIEDLENQMKEMAGKVDSLSNG